jgi:tetratricopeptide (TPR) repeat protein
MVVMSGHLAGAESRWTRLRSEHFVFVGDASERNIRDVALHLEQFRDVLSRVLPASALATTIPTTVFVFKNDASLSPYKATFAGKPVSVAGFFSGWTDRNLIAINVAAEQSALRIVFHEYAHFLVQNTSGRLPPWANEGVAGFYETFQDRSGGKSAFIGVPNEDYLTLLKTRAFMPLSTLLAIDYSSAEYNEGERRSVFYAESWALMHYLQLGSRVRASQLAQYLARLHDNGDPQETLSAVFGDVSVLERELRDYLRKFSFPVIRLDFREQIVGTGAGAADVLDDVTSTTYLADLLARTGHVDEARRQLQKLLGEHPDATAAAETLGVLELNAGNADRALQWLERAAADRTNAGAQMLWGRAAVARYERASNDGSDPAVSLTDARGALARAAELRPDDAETLATYGRAESLAGDDVAKALALLDKAVALAPGQEEYRMMLAEELVRQRQFTRATAILGPLAADARSQDVREAATRVLSRVERRASELARASEPMAAPGSSPAAGGSRPQFRVPRRDETRATGTLKDVDCENGTVILRVETEDESLRLSAARLDGVQFISYQASGAKSLACGPSGLRVFATYVESDAVIQATGIDGRAVAIEVLPKEYEER